MSHDTLDDAVAKLHAALVASPALTPAQRADLELVLRDVARALGPREATLADRANELTARFEASHPKLAESIAALARALAAIGI